MLVSSQGSTTYAELDRLSGRLATSLRSLGVEAGDRVVLAVAGARDYLVAYFGVLKAGGVVVPHGPDTRTALLCHVLEHSDARAVFLDARNLRLIDGQAERLPALTQAISVGPARLTEPGHIRTSELAALVASSDETQHAGASGDDLAAIVYTSGTTGNPKGVMLSHRNLLANARSILAYLHLGPDDVMAMQLPFYYAYGASVIHTHVAVGGTLAMVGSLAFPAAMLEAIKRFGCTGLAGVPSTFAHLVRLELERFDLSGLRYLTQAGGPMKPALTRKVLAAFPRARLFVMYGQTEASARLTYLPPDELPRRLDSVGIAIPGVTLEIRDEEGRPVAAGQTGEVVARGENVMRGYFRDPAATARALRPDGLHTGDLGYRDADGYLHLVARQSEIIKSGGHRIGPREVEQTIERLPGVAECAVVGVPDDLLGEAIAALVVCEPGAALDEDGIRRHAIELLPRHKVPARVCLVPALPRTPAGKLRRADLGALAATALTSREAGENAG